MWTEDRLKQSRRSRSSRPSQPSGSLVRSTFLLATLSLATALQAQTMARPGWAGSGMAAERWWPHAVLCQIQPDSLPSPAPASNTPTLQRLRSHLDDLQTLGVDALLLQNLEPEDLGVPAARPSEETPPAPTATPVAVAPVAQAAAIDPRYGTLDDLDDLVREAVRHGIRILVELRPGARGSALNNDARLWLSHGASGVSLDTDDPESIRTVRAVLHGYVGERLLIAKQSAITRSEAASVAPASSAKPDLLEVPLPSMDAGAAALRSTIEHARMTTGASGPIPLFTSNASPGDPAAARVAATILLGIGGAALLRVDDLDLAHSMDQATTGSVFAWYRQWSGLHRGNTVMRSGSNVLLDHDAEGALVWVRQLPGRAAPIVTICNLTGKPLALSLVSDGERLRLRGSFLRTLARSDAGMGAMPLRRVTLPPFAVYAGELSR